MNKKQLAILDNGMEKRKSLNVFFCHDRFYYNIVPLVRSEKAAIAARDIDFMLDGFLIFPLSCVYEIDGKGKKYNEIMRSENICKNLEVPDIDIASMKKICRYFKKSGEYISVETDTEYYIGKIADVSKEHIFFDWFDAQGIWHETVKIKISHIRLITYKSRYIEIFSKYVN